MRNLNRFEKFIFYPVAITWCFFSISLWANPGAGVQSPWTWLVTATTIALWFFATMAHYLLLVRVIIWFGFVGLPGWFLILWPWWAGALLELINKVVSK
jgi:hypothetical protein